MSPILGGFLAEPPEADLNALHAKGKLIEVGWVYTVIAGLLNVLAIFDALEGPALADEDAEAASKARTDRLQPEGGAA